MAEPPAVGCSTVGKELKLMLMRHDIMDVH